MTIKERYLSYCNRENVPHPRVDIKDLEQVQQSSNCLESYATNMFFLGYLRGHKAAKMEANCKKRNEE